MHTSEKINDKFEKLLKDGKEVFSKNGWDGRGWQNHPSPIDYGRFRTESMNLVRTVCGEMSSHYVELKRISDTRESGTNSYYFAICYGVLEAAYNDFKEGFLFDMRSLISAELLGDFLEQAEILLREEYYIPAASLAGAVLEDSLRKLSEKNDIEIPEKTKIDALNISLAKADIYNKLVQKQITAFADIRNNADHGRYDKFKKEDVEDMIKWVRRFERDYLES